MLSGIISIDDAYRSFSGSTACFQTVSATRFQRLLAVWALFWAPTADFQPPSPIFSLQQPFSASAVHFFYLRLSFFAPPPLNSHPYHPFLWTEERECGQENVSVGGNFECAQKILEVHCWVWQWHSAASEGCPCFPGRKGKKLECRAYNWALRNNRTVDSTMSPWLRIGNEWCTSPKFTHISLCFNSNGLVNTTFVTATASSCHPVGFRCTLNNIFANFELTSSKLKIFEDGGNLSWFSKVVKHSESMIIISWKFSPAVSTSPSWWIEYLIH